MTDATRYAILNANYIKARLEGPFPCSTRVARAAWRTS